MPRKQFKGGLRTAPEGARGALGDRPLLGGLPRQQGGVEVLEDGLLEAAEPLAAARGTVAESRVVGGGGVDSRQTNLKEGRIGEQRFATMAAIGLTIRVVRTKLGHAEKWGLAAVWLA